MSEVGRYKSGAEAGNRLQRMNRAVHIAVIGRIRMIPALSNKIAYHGEYCSHLPPKAVQEASRCSITFSSPYDTRNIVRYSIQHEG